MNREHKFRAWDHINKELVYNDVFYQSEERGFYAGSNIKGKWVEFKTIEQYTGYKMQEKDVYFGDLVSNNYKTDMEVLREVVMNKGCIMLKRVKGKSSLPKYIEIEAHGAFNYKIVNNIHEVTI